MVMFTKVNGWTIRPLEKAFTSIITVPSMMVSGLTIISTATVFKPGLMGANIKDNIRRERRTEKVSIPGKTAAII